VGVATALGSAAEFGDWDTEIIADAYGGDEAEEINARTGCNGCPLTEKDTALDGRRSKPQWSYLAPLKRLRPLYRELRKPAVRLRKRGLELRQDGTPAKNPQRMGPILLERRLEALDEVLAIQATAMTGARNAGRPLVDILNAEEEARIRELIAGGQWPDGWDGDEAIGDELLEKVFADGSVQPLLPMFGTKDES
jgi:DNA sulfur modification protein DndC